MNHEAELRGECVLKLELGNEEKSFSSPSLTPNSYPLTPVQFLFDALGIPLSAILLGLLTGLLTWRGTRRAFRDLNLSQGQWANVTGLIGIVLGAAFVWSALVWQSQSTPEVLPPEGWRQARVLYHLSLIVLLLIITATDFKSFYILDWCCWVGVIIAVSGAVLSGHFQIAHVWVDWNAEIPQFAGPGMPAWLEHHPHLHGLAWSSAGAACGFLSTAIVRWIAAILLRMPALGFGDV
ncbi:MAG TPA: hypothetical protein VNQ76_22150, partial [Planctomicrobium sp.]|nr:hypothetical protein [Planctomicrobium sp.]